MRKLSGALAFVFGLCVCSQNAIALPNYISQAGFVVDANGQPYDDVRLNIRVQFFESAEGGQPFYEELHPQVPFIMGNYVISIGSITPLNPLDFLRDQVYVGFTIGDEVTELERLPMFKVAASMVADVALNVQGDITPRSISIGNRTVIDENGRWVGDPSGLRGEAGPQGERGPEGPVGPRGPGGADANPDAVVPLVIQDLINDPPNNMPYVRSDRGASKAGDLTLDGGNLTINGGNIVLSGAHRTALLLRNMNVTGANTLHFNDPGAGEGIRWSGSQAQIYVAPLEGGNVDGYLRLINDEGISLESDVYLKDDVGIGTSTPAARLDVRGAIRLGSMDACARNNGGSLRWTGAALEICDGGEWTNILTADSNLLEQLVVNDGAGSGLDADRLDGLNSTQFMRADQNTGTLGNRLGVGTTNPSVSLHVIGDGQQVLENQAADGTSADLIMRGMPGNAVIGQIKAGKAGDFANVAGRDGYLSFMTGRNGQAVEGMRLTSNGRLGVGTDTPSTRLDVAGNARVSGFVMVGGAGADCAPANDGALRFDNGVVAVCVDGEWESFVRGDTDGQGSGLDADRIDGLDSTQFMRADQDTGTVGRISARHIDVNAGAIGAGSRDWMSTGVRVGGAGNNAYFGLSANQADAVIAWGDGAGDDLRFIFTPAGGGEAEKLRVLSSGQVGIGTSTPERSLHVVGAAGDVPNAEASSADSVMVIENNDDAYLEVVSNAAAGGGKSGMRLRGPDADIFGLVGYNAVARRLSLGNQTAPDAMVVNNTGNVGIGQGNPSARLVVQDDRDLGNSRLFRLRSAGNILMDFRQTGGAQTVVGGFGYRAGGDGALVLYNQGGSPDAADLTIARGGRVGIGNAAPDYALHVGDSASTAGGLPSTADVRTSGMETEQVSLVGANNSRTFQMAGTNTGAELRTQSTAGASSVTARWNTAANLNDHVTGLALEGGKVGIGRMAAEATLDVDGSLNTRDGGRLLRLGTDGSSNNVGLFGAANGVDGNAGSSVTISARNDNQSNSGLIKVLSGPTHGLEFTGGGYHPQTVGDIKFKTWNGTARDSAHSTSLIIKSGTHNVGIGTDTPSSKLQVAGDIRAEQICDENGRNCRDLSVPVAGNLWDEVDEGIAYAEGRVGIGTVNPAGRLHIARVNAGNSFMLEANGNGDDVPIRMRVKANNGTTSTPGILGRAGATSTDNRLWVTADGNYPNIVAQGQNTGVGTNSPSARLDVNGDIRIREGTNGNANLWFANAQNTQIAAVETQPGGDTLLTRNSDTHGFRFRTGAAANRTPMSITGNGRVGVNTASPRTTFHARGPMATGDADATVGDLRIYDSGDDFMRTWAVGNDSYRTDMWGTGAIGNWEVRDFNLNMTGGVFKIDSSEAGADSNANRYLSMSAYDSDGVIRINPGSGSTIYLNREVGTKRDLYIYDGDTNPVLSSNGADRRIGIRTATPRQALEVQGNILISGGNKLHLHDDGGADTLRGRLFAVSQSPHVRLYAAASSDVAIQDGENTNLFIEGTNGNVGIGTVAPAGKLHVNGRIESGNTGGGVGDLRLYDTGNNSQRTRGVGANSFLTDMEGTSAIGNWEVRDFNVNMTGGVFKIGSSERGADTNPDRFFSVSAYDSDGVVRINPGRESTLYLNREVGTSRNLHIWDGNANSVMTTIGSTRRVGIGTTNPASKLDVRGTVRAEQICDENGNNCQDLSNPAAGGGSKWRDVNGGIAYTQANVGVNTTRPTGRFHVGGMRDDRYVMFEARSNGDDIPVKFRTKAANGETTTPSLIGKAGTSGGNNALWLSSNGTFPNAVARGERLGIGTSSPDETLHVNGHALIGNGRQLRLRTGGNHLRGQIWASDSSPHLTIRTSGGEDMAFQDHTGTNMFIEGTNGHVGIGTTSPSGRLHVAGRIESGLTNGTVGDLRLYDTGNNSMRTRGRGANSFFTDMEGTGAIGQWEIRDFNIRMTGGVFKIDSSEAGTQTNSNRFLSMSAYDSDGVIRINPGSESTIYMNREVGVKRNLHIYDGDTTTVLTTRGSTRRVGINTSNPAETLHVNGHALISGSKELRLRTTGNHLRGQIWAQDSSPHLNVRTSGGEDIAFQDSTQTNMFIEGTNGYVGIGTTSPRGRLQVVGRIESGQTNATVGDLKLYDSGDDALRIRGVGNDSFLWDMDGTNGRGKLEMRDFNLSLTGGVFKVDSSEIGADTNSNRFLSISAYDSDGVIRINPGRESTIFMNREVGVKRNLHIYDGDTNSVFSSVGSSRSVGIRTTSPQEALHVNGHALISGSNQLRLRTNGNHLRGQIWAQDSSPHLNVRTSGGEDIAFQDSGQTNMFIEGTNGNVGIGTTSPDYPLDVQRSSTSRIKVQGSGNGYVNAAMVLQANDNDDYRGLGMFMQNMQGDRSWFAGNPYASPDQFVIARQTGVANHTDSTAQVKHSLFSVRSDGKMGVGTGSPKGMLHVKNVDARSRPVIFEGTVPGLYLHDSESLNGTLRYDSFAIEVDGNRLYMGGRSRNSAATPGSGNRRFTLMNDGRLGLNTSSPNERLTVNGHVQISAGHRLRLRTSSNNLRGDIWASESSPHLRMNTSGGEDIAFQDSGQTNMFIEGTNGNVGIGTTSPDLPLDVQRGGTALIKVQGTGNDYVNAGVVLQANDNDDYRGLGVYMQNMQGDRSWYAGNPYASPDSYMIARQTGVANHTTSTADRRHALMTIKNNGNMGLGTTNPGQKLSVNGNIEVMNGNQIYLRTGTNGNLRGYIRASEGSPHLDIATSGGEDIAFRDGGPDSTINMFIDGSNGNVGIGTTSTDERLTVNGNIQIDGGRQLLLKTERDSLRGYIRASEGSPHLDIATSGGEDMAFRDGGPDGTVNMMIKGNGYVGVGTSSPVVKLQVNGSIKVSNTTNTCNNSYAGVIRWSGGKFEGCNGSKWVRLDNQSSTIPTFAGLQGYYKFEGNYNDSSGLGRNASRGGDAAIQGTGIGQSVYFNGRGWTHRSRAWVQIPDSNGHHGNELSVAMWARSAQNNQYRGVWQMASKYSAYILGTGCWDCNTMCFIIHSSGWRYGSCYAVPDPNRWHHFVGTYDRNNSPNNTKKKLYVDGVLRSQNDGSRGGRLPGAIDNDGGPLDLGHRECCDHGNFNGWIDEVQIYNRELSADQVRQLYQSYNGLVR